MAVTLPVKRWHTLTRQGTLPTSHTRITPEPRGVWIRYYYAQRTIRVVASAKWRTRPLHTCQNLVAKCISGVAFHAVPVREKHPKVHKPSIHLRATPAHRTDSLTATDRCGLVEERGKFVSPVRLGRFQLQPQDSSALLGAGHSG